MRFRTRRPREPQLVVVSLIDVVLQLVIFLLLTTTFKASETSLDVNLPEAGTATQGGEGGIVVDIDEEGSLTVEGRAVPADILGDLLRKEAAGDRGRRVLIRADRSARHGDVVMVMDIARRNELRHLAIAAVSGGGDGKRPRKDRAN